MKTRERSTVFIFYTTIFIIITTRSTVDAQLVLAQPPVFRDGILAGDVVGSEGETIRLTCDQADFADTFEWRENDAAGLKIADAADLELQISRQNDAREIRCVARNTLGTTISQARRVAAKYLDDFDSSDESVQYEVTAGIGRHFVLRRPKMMASANLDVKFAWFKDDLYQVSPNLTHYITSEGDLIVTGVQKSDFGTYKVFASGEDLPEIVSQEYRVEDSGMSPSIPSTLSIIHWPTDRTILESATLRRESFDCATSLDSRRDAVRIRWFLDGEPISEVDPTHFEITAGGRRLAILNPNGFTKGEHKLECKADAAMGRTFDQKSTTFTFVARPILRDLPQEVQKPLGSEFSQKCGAKKSKTDEIKWFKNGIEIPTQRGKLQIQNLKHSDFGIYQCEAKNEAGSDLKQIWLKEGTSDIPAEIMRDLPAQNSNSQENSSQEVEFFGDLSGEIELDGCSGPWDFQGQNLESGEKYQILENSLKIQELAKSDEGIYKCQEKIYKLQVSGQTRLIEYGPTDQKSLIGTNVEFGCEVAKEFARKAQIEWFLNDSPIGAAGNSGLRISRNRKGSLIIRQVGPDNTGEYRCVVKYEGRVEEASAMLQIIEKPAMPERVKAELHNETMPAKVRVTWAEGFDGNEPIIKHAIEMRTLGPTGLWSDWQSIVDNIPKEDSKPCCWADIEDLKPSSIAEFRVVASNKHGPGKASLPTGNITMPQQPPSAAPRNVAASARSSHSVIVQWQQPKEEHASGDVVGYVVRYRLAGYSSLSWNEKNVTSKDARNAVIDDLITWREYEIQVAAYNKRGLGVFSESIEVTTSEGVPTQAPKNLKAKVLNSTAVEVSFTAPDQQRIPGVNLGYKIQFWKSSEQLFKQVLVDPDRKQISLIVFDLEKFGHYNLTVRCYTAPGDGPATPGLQIVTEEDRPEKVDQLAIEEVYYNGALVTWQQPIRSNGKILKYTMRWWRASSEDQGKSKEVKDILGNVLNYTIEGLEPSTRYIVDVQAHTIKGPGPLEETKFESGVPPELPGRPTSLSIGEISANTVQLHFTPGFDGHTAIRHWIVEAKQPPGGVYAAVFNITAPKARSITVTGLRPYTSYQLRLIAENVKGRGAPSEASRVFETLETNPEPPGMIYSQPISADKVQVSWTPLLANHWNGNPKGYLVTYRISDSKDQEWKEVRTSALRTSQYVLSDLAPYKNYEINVFAENAFGRSMPQKSVQAKTFESTPSSAPGSLHATPDGSKAILVKWQPLDTSQNGEILGYRVRAVENEESSTSLPILLDVPGEATLIAKITGLRPFTRYAISVAAMTLVGAGPFSPQPVEVETAEDVPNSPDVFQCSFVSESEVRWKWTPPREPNGKITSYIVSYWKSHEPRSMAIDAPLLGNLLFFSATNLNPNTQYTFAIKSLNSKGESDELVATVLTSSARVPIRNPPLPTRDPASTHSPQEITIKWDDGSQIDDVESPVRLVQISHQKANEDDWITVDHKFAYAKKRARIANLSPNSMYRMRIRYFGDFLESSWSAESEWMRTLESAPTAPPTALQAAPHTPTSFHVTWTVPHQTGWNSNSVGYRISWKEYGGSGKNSTWQSREIAPRQERLEKMEEIVEGLEGFRHYIVRVRLWNSEGDGPESTPVFVFVGFAVPQGSVDGLSVEPMSSSELKLKWMWPGNETTMMFKISYVPIASVLSEISTEEEIMIVDTTEARLENLRKFQEYQITVAPYNRAGQGQPKQIRSQTLEDLPGPVGPLQFSDILLDSVKVSWTPPAQPNGNIVGYLVNYKGVRMLEEFKNEEQHRVSVTELEAQNLAEGVTYFFSVWAQTSAGKGELRQGNVTIGPNPRGPLAPGRPRVTPKQSAVSLTWPGSQEDDIVGFLIQAKRVSASDNSSSRPKRSASSRPTHPIGEWITLAMVRGANAETQVSYRDLQPSSFYVFRVYARNPRGIGTASPETEQLYVPEMIPDDPFYTTWWFLALVGMAAFVLIVVFVAVLCVTGSSAKYRREKRCRSVDSLQLADGNFASFQLKGTNSTNMQRMPRGIGISKNPPDLPATRPGTTQSWLSDRDPPAYGSVGGGLGGPARVSNRPSPPAVQNFNMYGLATDVIPNSEAMQRLQAMVGGANMSNGVGEYMVTRSSDYGRVERLPSSQQGASEISEEYDSFDEEDAPTHEERPESVDGDTIRGDGIARHYGMLDETWRKVRDTEVVRIGVTGGAAANPPPSAGGRSSATESTVTADSSSTVPSSWNNHHHTSNPGPNTLATGFSSFV